MARIKCRTPSTGKAIRIALTNVSDNYVTLVEAPDFSVPDAAGNFPIRDPLDDTRTIKPGEIFFLSPLAAKNKSANTAWIETAIFTEDGETYEIGKVSVPAGDTVFIPIQGRSLFKRNPDASNGDALIIRAETVDTFDVSGAAEEKLSSEHIGVE